MRAHAVMLAWFALLAGASPAPVHATSTEERRFVSHEEFKRLVGPEEYARLMREAEKQALGERSFELIQREDKLYFSGAIYSEAARALERAIADPAIKELRVNSAGGVVEAGQRMGQLVRDRKVPVVVAGVCISSCANYLFTAGTRRVILPDSIVVWHGSTLQRDFRELVFCGRTISSLNGSSLLPDEVAIAEADIEDRKRRQQADIEFFRSIGVDEYITRVGQEPRFYGNFTLTVADMARFGLTDVEAPADYGTESFCKEVNRKRPGLSLHCVAVSDRMLAYERARRALGERCRADGTLEIRSVRPLRWGGLR